MKMGFCLFRKRKKSLFIGKYARQPRFQGGGSSHINSHKVTGAWDVVKDWGNITFAEGYGDQEDVTDEALIAEAVEKSRQNESGCYFCRTSGCI